MLECDLIDCWRDQHIESKEYTWFKKNTNKKARLDFLLISRLLLTDMSDVKICPGYRTDHSLLYLKFTFGKFKKGKSYWKFNNSLLTDTEYINSIKRTITLVKEQYAVNNKITDEKENMISDNDINLSIDDQLFFEILLCELRGKTISHSSYIKKKEKDKEKTIIEMISNLEKQPIIQNEILNTKKGELEQIREKKMRGVLVRSRAKWIQEGEKPTKYFCNLENNNFVSKTMLKLKSKDNKILNNHEDIMNETKSFYQNLYEKKPIENVNLNNLLSTYNIPKLSNIQKNQLEGLLTYEECQNTLKNMNNDKSPGNSGFTVEFYKFFWKDIGNYLVRSLNKGFLKGELSITQKQGVITCIPKGDKDKMLLKNWRPISLLNVCYKIASGSIANRLKNILGSIIDEDQTGFLQDRFIGENTRLIYDVIFYAQKYNIPGLLLLIDFEKAFDSIEWSFIDNVLNFYNFGPDFIKWINTFYKNIESSCLINGHMSEWFLIQRGCRQGDPISSYIFILCAEVLAILIRNNNNIKGINIGNTEYVISQFADDTTLILNGTEKSLRTAMDTLKFYERISGLKINIEKTKGIWIGSKVNSTEQICEHIDFSSKDFKALGITFSTNLDRITKINYDTKIGEIKNTLNRWKRRVLTPFGKISVLKSLIISKLNHLLFSIPDPDEETINLLNSMFFDFLWNGKPDKIKRSTTYNDYSEGGIKMINIRYFLASIKISCIKRVLNGDNKIFEMIKNESKNIMSSTSFGSLYLKNILENVHNPFWKNALQHYSLFIQKIIPKTSSELHSIPIWYNENIKAGDKHLFKQNYYEKGILLINDIVNINGDFLSYNDFQQIYNVKTHFLEYASILSSVKFYSKHFTFKDDKAKNHTPDQPIQIKLINENRKGCKHIYNRLQSTNEKVKFEKWTQELKLDFSLTKLHFIPFKCCNNKHLQWFQCRINYRILGINYLLEKIKIKSSNLCSYCKLSPETIHHLFCECQQVIVFWNNFKQYLRPYCIHDLHLSNIDILFGNCKFDDILNTLLIIAKYCVFTNRTSGLKPTVTHFKRQLKFYFEVEYQIALKYSDLTKFHTKWAPYNRLVADTMNT